MVTRILGQSFLEFLTGSAGTEPLVYSAILSSEATKSAQHRIEHKYSPVQERLRGTAWHRIIAEQDANLQSLR